MLTQDRKEANDDQIRTFLVCYDKFWRLSKIVSTKFLLDQREELKSVYKDYYGEVVKDYNDFVYKNITNGLILSTLSETVMLCEDYFCLLKFIRDDQYFVQRLINYSAASVTAISKNLIDLSEEFTRSLFMIPSHDFMESCFRNNHSNDEAKAGVTKFNSHLQQLVKTHNEIITFFNRYHYFYLQYKHGLKLCINSFGHPLGEDEIDRRKTDYSISVFGFDNKPLKHAYKEGGLIIPNIACEAIKKNLNSLSSICCEREYQHINFNSAC